MSKTQSFDTRAAEVKRVLSLTKGEAPTHGTFEKIVSDNAAIAEPEKKLSLTTAKQLRENIIMDLRAAASQVDSLRAGSNERRNIDISWGDFAKEKWGFATTENGQAESFYQALGINPSHNTIDSLMTMPDFDEGMRFVIPEIIREAVRLGLRKNPLYPNLIAAEQSVSQPSLILPHINMSDAMPKLIGENETIPVGTVSFGQKRVELSKVATGIKITDEVQKFVSINILSLYLEDVGVKMNLALDNMLINVLINGDGNSNAAPVIGVESAGTWDYKSLLRAWIRMGLLGRLPQGMISNENPALDILMLPEFKGYGTGIGPISGNQIPNVPRVNLRTPVPTNQNYDIHGAMPATNQIMLVDNTSAAIKLNASALRVENQRIADRQISGTYISMMTGFAKLFDDSTLIIDKSLNFSAAGFPSWMDATASQNQAFKS